ncbi:MAG: 2-oxo acid dehydrogenase subunit E2 [Deltaproteobacteria bacterium]|nr:2-oxo acid dehydrogenase subunit E2 [Deltaproteobacteria bacterium]
MADVIMPQLGESIAEGTIVRWLKKVGDRVKRDEDLLVVSTDKVEAELPSPADGILQDIRVAEGKTVPIKTVIAVIGDGPVVAAPPPAAAAAPAPSRPTPAPAAAAAAAAAAAPGLAVATTSAPQGRLWYSPLVRKIARDEGIPADELRGVGGTGFNGRISKKDILAYAEARRSRPGAPVNGSDVAGRQVPVPPAGFQENPTLEMPRVPTGTVPKGPARPTREELVPMTTIRRLIADNMVRSKQTSAHVQTIWEVDFSAVARMREKHKEAFKRDEGVGLTYTVFIAAAVARTLRRHPYVNAEVRGDSIAFKKDVHLGLAVDLGEDGLIVPVVPNAQDLNLRGLARAIDELAARARKKRLKADEIKGGTFTITNPGVFGSLFGTPIINQPEVAILGVGAVVKRAVVMETAAGDVIGIKPMAILALSFDHRIVDGATADRFMKDLKAELENWNTEP